MAAKRHFLFLQGNASPFYKQVGLRLAAWGHEVSRINFGGGDRLFWNGPHTIDYRSDQDGFGLFVTEFLDRRGVSDLVLFGDCRKHHCTAIEAARVRRLRINVFEEGYIRPHWITLERDGVNGYSRLPRDPAWYRENARDAGPLLEQPVAVGGGLSQRILYDFAWQAAHYAQKWRFPRHPTHRPYPIWAEYATWAGRLVCLPHRHRHADRIVGSLGTSDRPYFLFPLQLDSDTQIRVHSSFGRLVPAIEAVVDSFARAAPDNSLLLVKNHPLDNGWIDYARLLRNLAHRHALGDRLLFIDGGALDRLIDGARGLVTVNSTTALPALERGCPTITLGRAIYDIPGLTFDGRLDDFWMLRPGEQRPDPGLYADFVTAVTASCLINGNFYTADGLNRAVKGATLALIDDHDPLADAPQPKHRRHGDKRNTDMAFIF